MLLNNFKKFLEPITNLEVATMSSNKPKNTTSAELSGLVYRPSTGNQYASSQFNITSSYGGLVFGSGNTPVTINDTKLENRIYEKYTPSNGGYTVTNDKAIFTEAITATDSITISEIGIRYTATSENDATNSCLVARTVLDSPVILNSGDTKVFTVTIDYNKFIDNTAVSS